MRLYRILGFVVVALLAVSAFTSLPRLVSSWMGGVWRPEPADAIVVLGTGGADPDGAISRASLRRTLHGIALYRRGLAPVLVLSGSASQEGPDEAAVRADVARGFGVPSDAILTESRAHTTREEALLLRARLQPRGLSRILLVADPVDSGRARRVFERAGFAVFMAPTDPGSVSDPEARLALTRRILGEWVAWGYYWAAGYL